MEVVAFFTYRIAQGSTYLRKRLQADAVASDFHFAFSDMATLSRAPSGRNSFVGFNMTTS
jgi:hypothetical protein